MLALQTRTLFNFLFQRQYAGIPRDIDTKNLNSLNERAPVVITQTKMDTHYVVIPDPTTVVVTYHVPAVATQGTDPANLPPASKAPDADTTPVPGPDPVADDSPAFASLIVPTSQEVKPVPTAIPAGEAAPGGEVVPGGAATPGGEVIPVGEVIPGGAATPLPGGGNLNETAAPVEPIAQPTSQEPPQEIVPPVVPTAQPADQQPPRETPENARLIDGSGFLTPTAQPAVLLPTTQPVIAQPTSQEAPKETPENARLIGVPDDVATSAKPTTQQAPEETLGNATTSAQQTTQQPPKETPENARLVDIPDSVTTNAQPTSQDVPKETPENARLIETESESPSSTSEMLVFDTASFTYTGPPSRSTTLQTRPGTKTFTSAIETTEVSDSFVFDDGETGSDGSGPSLTTATLPDGALTTIDLDATAASDRSSETESPEAIAKQESDNAPSTPVVVGSVVGSILGLSFLALVIFWLIKRRAMQRRRSTLLTPLDFPPSAPGSARGSAPAGALGGQEKYEIDNNSLGPTPRSTKVAAAMSANAKKISRRFRQSMTESSYTDASRANSHFGAESQNMPTTRAPGRANSGHGQQQGWWSRLIEESSVVDLTEAPPMPASGNDGRQTPPSPNPFSDFHSTASPARNISYGYNNHMSLHGSLVPQPLDPVRSPPTENPFADGNSALYPGPTQSTPMAYRESVQHRRSPSVARNLTPHSTGDNPNLAPQDHWRGNVHSNPFDLELHGPHLPGAGNVQQKPRYTAVSSFYSTNRQTVRHSRAESYTSKYTSGVSSVSEWPPVPAHPPVPSIYGRYDDNDFLGQQRHSRSESDSGLRRQGGHAM
ncbi:hypothetical protein DER45DRAFT_325958 [Fusarium avenaceum]|nr:hypothetical protein DER45DRAFT_325958 [Fusarium avenaceum]